MIKFNCIIHKETGTVIKYEDWLKEHKYSGTIKFQANLSRGSWYYDTKNMLFSDDFKIIYGSEFSNLELITLFGNCATSSTQLKLKRIIDGNINLKREYGIEV